MLKKMAISMALITMMLASGISAAAELVNINKATAAAIQQNLLGIGPIKAESIISYRKKNGKFKSLDDLLNVKGIGPTLVKKNKRYLSLTKGVVSGDDKAYAAAKKQAGKSKSSSTKKKAKPAKKKTSKTKDKSKSTKKKPTKSGTDKPAKKKPAKKKKTSKSTT